jgi:hypothetical protein
MRAGADHSHCHYTNLYRAALGWGFAEAHRACIASRASMQGEADGAGCFIGLLVAGALYHYFVRHDRMMQRMLPAAC